MRIKELLGKVLAQDETSRSLQLSGLIRFSILIIQGIILVKCGLDPTLIAVVESFYFLYNLSRFFFLSGGKYAGFSRLNNSTYSFSAIFWGFNIIGAVAALVSVVIMYFGSADFNSFLELRHVKWALPVLVLLSLPVDTFDLFYIEKKKPNSIVNYTLINSLIQTTGLVYLMTQGFHMGHVVLFFLCYYIFRWLHLLLFSDAKRTFPGELAFAFAVFALPLILHALFSGMTDYVDGWLIKTFFDDSAFAVYRYGARELPLNAILIGAVTSGLILYKSGINEAIKREIKKMLAVLTPLLSILVLISPLLFEYFYSSDYKMSALYFNIYALLIISHVLFVQVFYYRADDRWLLSFLSLIEVVSNVIVSIWFLNIMGILGIPLATLAVDFVFRLLLMLIVHRRYKEPLADYYPFKMHIACSVILLISFALSYLIHFS